MQMNVSAVTDRHDSQYDRAKNGPSIKKSVEFYKNGRKVGRHAV